MSYDVTIDREYYIGGSDIPAIMGISPFKTRYQLLLEKAGIEVDEFEGNEYTEYGNVIEPQIRDYINKKRNTTFEPNRIIDGVFRGHTDGFNGDCVLEIKSTSKVHETVDEYKIYLVQLLKYMEKNKVEKGILAVYERPKDFNPVFNPDFLHEYDVNIETYKSLLEEINAEIERFLRDLERLKENPLLTEEDFQPNDLVVLSNKAVALENRMAEFKALEEQYKEMKQALFEAMVKYGVKSWQMPNGTKVTRVDEVKATVETVTEFDTKAFKAENAELFEKYSKTVQKKKNGRAGYVKITAP